MCLTWSNLTPELSVLMVSLKSGGQGLNLQMASNVIILDPWYALSFLLLSS